VAGPIKRSYTPEKLLEIRSRVDGFAFDLDAARAAATARLAGFRYLRGDLHTHSLYSDGKGSVADNQAVAQRRGLDFLFITDHGTVRQKAECRRFRAVWWGQEPGAGPQHICILGNERKFTPRQRIGPDAERLRAAGLFFFYPHPTGWFPLTWYPRESVEALAEAGPRLAMEVMNGIFRSTAFHDAWEESFVALWDRLLGEGRRVIGLAGTDAHMPATVGNVWTGVLGARLTRTSVLKALAAGRAFASAGPAIQVFVGGVPMGGEAAPRRGRLRVRFEVADSYGLNWACVVSDCREVRRFEYRGRPRAVEEFSMRVPADGRYVRIECAAMDDRRAYANPVYLRG
jgi:hypothetical protein